MFNTGDLAFEIPFNRHPLHEQIADIFVPNDAHIIGGAGIGSSPTLPDDNNQWNSILLCTGANACGKVHAFIGLVRIRTHRSFDRAST